MDSQGRRAWVNEQDLNLTATEFNLLLELAARPGHARTRSHLVGALPEGGRDALDRTVDVHIRNVRRKIAEAGGPPRLIETVSGVGYRFTDDPARYTE